MQIDRAVVEQALEALEWHYRQGHSNTLGGLRLKIDEKALRNLRAALAQQAEPVSADPHTTTLRNLLECCLSWERDACVLGTVTARQAVTALRAALAQQAEPVEPVATVAARQYDDGTYAGNALDWAGRNCEDDFPVGTKLYTAPPQRPAESVPEPVGQLQEAAFGRGQVMWFDKPADGTKLYTAPPQRRPLTEEEILAAVGWERAEMYMKLAPNFPVDEAKQETLKNARAVEKASWEKNHG